MKCRSILILILFTLAIFLTACSSGTVITSTLPASSTSASDGASLVQQRCTACHPISQVERSRFSAAEWKVVVYTMISRGAQLTPEEETIVINYLTASYGQ